MGRAGRGKAAPEAPAARSAPADNSSLVSSESGLPLEVEGAPACAWLRCTRAC
jgi:hypothetical protein